MELQLLAAMCGCVRPIDGFVSRAGLVSGQAGRKFSAWLRDYERLTEWS